MIEISKILLTSSLSAVALFFIAKVIGHKQMSQLDFFDYITGITIGSIAAELATNLEDPWKPFLAMVVYGVLSWLLALTASKCPRLRKYINGTPTIIMDKGKIYRKNMKKAKLELSEFMVLCRQEGYFNLNDIQTAVFEYNGRLTILPISTKRPLTAKDVDYMLPPDGISTEVILDGRILEENLQRMNLDLNWLQKELESQGYESSKEIFLAICDENGQLTFFETGD